MKVDTSLTNSRLAGILQELQSGTAILDVDQARTAVQTVLADKQVTRAELQQLQQMLPTHDLVVGEERRGEDYLKAFLAAAEKRMPDSKNSLSGVLGFMSQAARSLVQLPPKSASYVLKDDSLLRETAQTVLTQEALSRLCEVYGLGKRTFREPIGENPQAVDDPWLARQVVIDGPLPWHVEEDYLLYRKLYFKNDPTDPKTDLKADPSAVLEDVVLLTASEGMPQRHLSKAERKQRTKELVPKAREYMEQALGRTHTGPAVTKLWSDFGVVNALHDHQGETYIDLWNQIEFDEKVHVLLERAIAGVSSEPQKNPLKEFRAFIDQAKSELLFMRKAYAGVLDTYAVDAAEALAQANPKVPRADAEKRYYHAWQRAKDQLLTTMAQAPNQAPLPIHPSELKPHVERFVKLEGQAVFLG